MLTISFNTTDLDPNEVAAILKVISVKISKGETDGKVTYVTSDKPLGKWVLTSKEV